MTTLTHPKLYDTDFYAWTLLPPPIPALSKTRWKRVAFSVHPSRRLALTPQTRF